MFRGIETAAAGMSSIIDLNDIIANNLANINSPGFKQLIPAFREIHESAVRQQDSSGNRSIGTLSVGSTLDTTQLDFNQGVMKKTDSPFDVALNGDGFFVVQTDDGKEFYTRNGAFSLNEDGDLVSSAGYFVCGESGGSINIDLTGKSINDINITNDGIIMLDNQEIDRLKVVNFEDLSTLKAKGNSLFVNIDKNNTPEDMENFIVNQGYIEGSNANVVESLINSISGSRTYETLSKIINNTDSTLRKAVTDVGRVT